MNERRADPRRLTCIPAYVEAEGEHQARDSAHLALIHDASTQGALLLTRSKLGVDEEVSLSLYLRPEQEPRQTRGRVVRAERRAIDRSDVWQWEIGVRFDEPISEYAEEIEALCRRQREVGVLKE